MNKFNISNKRLVSHIAKSFEISLGDIKKIIKNFHSEMLKGLSGHKSSLAMIPSFVDMPKGNETGKYIALDLGGTNFRILEVELKAGGRIDVIAEDKFKLEKEIVTGTGRQMFDFIAESIKYFLHVHKMSLSGEIDLGFTFSFPLNQTSIAGGILLFWNKGFSASNVIGKDVVALLNAALKRQGIDNIKIAALVNDTVGTLIAKAYGDSYCDLGVIFGTGTNACYPEKISKIKKARGLKTSTGYMVINTEWGNFNKLNCTSCDTKIDKASSNPGRQRLEKMVSGMYLGEIARTIIIDLVERKILFNGNIPSVFSKPYGFDTKYLSEIESDNSKNLMIVKNLLIRLGIANAGYTDSRLIRNISKIVVMRSAYISAAVMAAVILWMDPKIKRIHTIAIDGSLFEKCLSYQGHIKSVFQKFFKDKADKINFVLAKDGSGKGAAIIAAVASRL